MRIRSFAPLMLGALVVPVASCDTLGLGDAVGLLGDDGNTQEPAKEGGFVPATSTAEIAQVLVERLLTSNRMDVGDFRDSNLKNPWGIAFGPDGAAWVAKNGAGLASAYNAQGELLLTLSLPAPKGGTAAPTSQVYNGDTGAFLGDQLIFVTEDGAIAGWQSRYDGAARLRTDEGERQVRYKGVALARQDRELRLYAADFFNARIDVLGKDYQLVAASESAFVDVDLPPNYAPFNVIAVDDLLLVSYAEQQLPDKKVDSSGPGKGFIDLFDADGHLLKRLVSRGALNSPWGMAIAPSNYGNISGRMLVANSGDGKIGVYRLSLGSFQLQADFEGVIGTSAGSPWVTENLWGIAFPSPIGAFDPRALYFTAGPNLGKDGVFGKLTLP